MVCNQEGVVRVKVNQRCEKLIENCKDLHFIEGTSVIWEPTRKDIEREAGLKYVKHIYDAASYLVERYDPIRLIVPPSQRNNQRIVTRTFTA